MPSEFHRRLLSSDGMAQCHAALVAGVEALKGYLARDMPRLHKMADAIRAKRARPILVIKAGRTVFVEVKGEKGRL